MDGGLPEDDQKMNVGAADPPPSTERERACHRARTSAHRARTNFCTQHEEHPRAIMYDCFMLNDAQGVPLEEAARRTGVHRTTLSRAVKRGELRARTVHLHGKSRLLLDPTELAAWVRERAHEAPSVHADAPEAEESEVIESSYVHSTVHGHTQATPEIIRLLELLERAHERARCASVQAVRLEHELHSYQRALTEHAESLAEREARAKTAEARLQEFEDQQRQLLAENEARLQAAEQEREELASRVRLAEERVSWLERRIPRWIRRALGA